MSAPQNEFDGAQRIVQKYYRELVKRIAEDIIQNQEDFESHGYASKADEIIDRHAMQLYRVCQVFSALNHFAFREKPQGKEPLAKDEFRCFGCGGVIRQLDQRCSLCGWTWK